MKILVDVPDDLVSDYIDRADVSSWGIFKRRNEMNWTFTIKEFEGGRVHSASREAIENGVALLARDLPHHFRDLISDKGDAITGNYLVQTIVFGRVEYE